MSNFPVGSKIIIKNADRGEVYKNGDILTIANTDDNSGCGVHATFNGETRYVSNREFVAYVEPFKVGDEVITTATNSEWGYKLGAKGTVDYIDSQEPKVRLKGAGYHFTEDLKLAPAKAEPTPTSHIKVLATQHPREYEVGDILEVSENQSWCVGGEIRVTNKHGNTSVVFKGQWEYVAAPVKAEPERKFKVGDKVVVQANPEWAKEGQTGVIERVDLEDSGLPYDVKGDEEWNFWMRAQDLELAKEYTFADILKGDTIRAEYTQNGVKYTREGTVATTSWNDEQWFSAEGDYVADSFWKGATYTLLERPEPPKPNPFAEAKVGSLALQDDGYVWYKVKPDLWKFLSKSGGGLAASTGETNALMAQEDDRKITYSAP